MTTPTTTSLRRRLSVLLPAALITATAGIAVTAGPAEAGTCTHIGTSLKVNQTMTRGQCITSTNGRFLLLMETDGNLVSFRQSDGRACFSSGTPGRKDAVAYVNPLLSTAPVPLELNIVHQSDIHSGYTGFAGYAAGHPASTLNVSVSGSNGSLYVGYSEYYGINANAKRVC